MSDAAVVDPNDFVVLLHYLQTFPGLNRKIAAELINNFGISVLEHLDAHPKTLCRYVAPAKASNAVQGMTGQDVTCRRALAQLAADDVCRIAQGRYVYRAITAEAEYGIAQELIRIMQAPVKEHD